MTKSKPVSVNGDTRSFAISDEIKRYSMIDLGFKETNNKNFVYDHPLYNESPYNATMKLKITINAAMDKLSMVITDKSGLQKVNIFKDESLKPARELLEYMLRDLMEKQVIEEV